MQNVVRGSQAARHAEAPHGSGSGDYDSHKAVGLSWLRLPEPHATAPFQSTCGYWARAAYNPQQFLRPHGLCLPLPKCIPLFPSCACAEASGAAELFAESASAFSAFMCYRFFNGLECIRCLPFEMGLQVEIEGESARVGREDSAGTGPDFLRMRAPRVGGLVGGLCVSGN